MTSRSSSGGAAPRVRSDRAGPRVLLSGSQLREKPVTGKSRELARELARLRERIRVMPPIGRSLKGIMLRAGAVGVTGWAGVKIGEFVNAKFLRINISRNLLDISATDWQPYHEYRLEAVACPTASVSPRAPAQTVYERGD